MVKFYITPMVTPPAGARAKAPRTTTGLPSRSARRRNSAAMAAPVPILNNYSRSAIPPASSAR